MNEEPWWHSQNEPPPGMNGSAAEEAARLFMAMRDRFLADPTALRAGAKLLETLSVLRGATNPVPPGDAPECAYCPFCQAMAHAKSLSPETVERLTGAAMEFAETVRTIVVDPRPSSDDRVRHVPLDEDFEDWPEPAESADEPADSTEDAAEQETGPDDQ